VKRGSVISEQTFYNWKRKYGGMGVSELRRMHDRDPTRRGQSDSLWIVENIGFAESLLRTKEASLKQRHLFGLWLLPVA
jgi:hypothetical protein